LAEVAADPALRGLYDGDNDVLNEDLNQNGVFGEPGVDDPYIAPITGSFDICLTGLEPWVNGVLPNISARVIDLPPGRYARLIFLTDTPHPAKIWVTQIWKNSITPNSTDHGAMAGVIAQENEQGTWQVSPSQVLVHRGVSYHDGPGMVYCGVSQTHIFEYDNYCGAGHLDLEYNYYNNMPAPLDLTSFPAEIDF
jgi:hypothetical protein